MVASAAYLALLDQLRSLHERKSAGYSGAENPDPWSNFRRASEFGITPDMGALIRLSDKFSRLAALTRDPANEQANESIEDTAMDLAAYALIFICLRRERLGG